MAAAPVTWDKEGRLTSLHGVLLEPGPRLSIRTDRGEDLAAPRDESWTGGEAGLVEARLSCPEVQGPVRRLMGRLCLPPDRWQIYTQASGWSRESQGSWTRLAHGELTARSADGRSTEQSAPIAALRPEEGGPGLVLHLVPDGDWQITIRARPAGGGAASLELEWGLDDRFLRLDDPCDLPLALFSPLPPGARLEDEAWRIHQWALDRSTQAARPCPVLYNTWFDQYDNLELPRLRRQLVEAEALGCEAFVIDAGWFGSGSGRWFEETGDWEEALPFPLDALGDEVRAAGLGFGLWIEPEHVGARSRLARERPSWVRGSALDIQNPDAAAWIKEKMLGLVDRHRLAWVKVDFNIGLGVDPQGLAFRDRSRAWFRLMDEIRAARLGTVFEGCSSGAMRLDLESIRHFECSFLSDNVNPYEALRLFEGTSLRIPPGIIGRWSVVRSLGRPAPDYPGRAADAPVRTGSYQPSGWQPDQTPEWVDPLFSVLSCLPGQLGISGDLAGLSEEAREAMRKGIAFYKENRAFFRTCRSCLLTSVRPLEDRQGWSAVQAWSPSGARSIVTACRLQDVRDEIRVWLRQIDPEARYDVRSLDGEEEVRSGASLVSEGLAVSAPRPGSAGAWVLRRVE